MDLVFTICLMIVSASSHVSGCNVNDIEIQPNFNLDNYMGKWYEVLWAPPHFEKVEDMYVDYTEVFSMAEDGNVTSVTQGRIPGKESCLPAKGRLMYVSDVPGKMYNILAQEQGDSHFDYWVLETDYTSYSVVYGCDVVNETSGVCIEFHAWVWGRETSLDDDTLTKAYAAAEKACVTEDDMSDTPQEEECDDDAGGAVMYGVCGYTLVTALVMQVLLFTESGRNILFNRLLN